MASELSDYAGICLRGSGSRRRDICRLHAVRVCADCVASACGEVMCEASVFFAVGLRYEADF